MKKFLNLLSDFYYNHLTEKEKGKNYEGSDFDDRLSHSIALLSFSKVLVFILVMILFFDYFSKEKFSEIFFTWLIAEIVGGLVSVLFVPSDLRWKFFKGLWLPLFGVWFVAGFEKASSDAKMVK